MNVLVVIVSWVTDDWSHKVHVIDFKEVERTIALITASELRETLLSVNFRPSLCVAYQSDNCSSMMAASRIFRTSILHEDEDLVDEHDQLEDPEQYFTVESRVDDHEYEQLNITGLFVGCGAHRLNNVILDATRHSSFFNQANAFCMANKGPALSATSGTVINVKRIFFIKNNDFLETARSANLRQYSLLYSFVVKQMNKLLLKMKEFCRLFEIERPITDHFVAACRRVTRSLSRILEDERAHHIVKNFSAQLMSFMDTQRRFRGFSDPQLAAAFLNPNKTSRLLLTAEECSRAKAYILNPFQKIGDERVAINDIPTENEPRTTSCSDPIDDAFQDEDFNITAKQHCTGVRSVGIDPELEEFTTLVDETDLAFDFFKQHYCKYPKPKKVARVLLCVLPSLANAERAFSRAGVLFGHEA